MSVHPIVLAALIMLALPTVVLGAWTLYEVALRRLRRSRLWPMCRAPFDPADDPDYHTHCIEPRWHEGKHHDGSYLFATRKDTP